MSQQAHCIQAVLRDCPCNIVRDLKRILGKTSDSIICTIIKMSHLNTKPIPVSSHLVESSYIDLPLVSNALS